LTLLSLDKWDSTFGISALIDIWEFEAPNVILSPGGGLDPVIIRDGSRKILEIVCLFPRSLRIEGIEAVWPFTIFVGENWGFLFYSASMSFKWMLEIPGPPTSWGLKRIEESLFKNLKEVAFRSSTSWTPFTRPLSMVLEHL